MLFFVFVFLISLTYMLRSVQTALFFWPLFAGYRLSGYPRSLTETKNSRPLTVEIYIEANNRLYLVIDTDDK